MEPSETRFVVPFFVLFLIVGNHMDSLFVVFFDFRMANRKTKNEWHARFSFLN